MGVRKLEDCKKGDIEKTSFKPDIPKFEILVERSSHNRDDVRVTLWKKEDDKFQVSLLPCGENNKIIPYREYKQEDKGEALPWALYEGCCDVYGCSPYPEAEAYYKRKGL